MVLSTMDNTSCGIAMSLPSFISLFILERSHLMFILNLFSYQLNLIGFKTNNIKLIEWFRKKGKDQGKMMNLIIITNKN